MASRRQSALLIPFAWSVELKRYVEPSEVPNGRGCGCICEACNKPVIAKHPETNIASHFAHESGSTCANGLETAIHRAAKQILAKERRLWIPSALGYSNDLHPVIAVREQVITVENVEVEKAVGEFRPDVLVTGSKGRQIAVEIVVTHPVGSEKENFYRWSRLSALQIDLKKVRSTLSLSSLRNLLLKGGRETTWIHNEFVEAVQQRLADEAKPRAITWRQSHKRTGKVPHVDSCPVPRRESPKHGSHFSNAKLDCPGCAYFTPPKNPNRIFNVMCSGHLAEKFPEPSHEDLARHYGMPNSSWSKEPPHHSAESNS
jgi:hypothetical protein